MEEGSESESVLEGDIHFLCGSKKIKVSTLQNEWLHLLCFLFFSPSGLICHANRNTVTSKFDALLFFWRTEQYAGALTTSLALISPVSKSRHTHML